MKYTQAIILKREDFRERDERISLYSKDFGKLNVVAKGLKCIQAKLRGNLDIFNLVDIIFVEGRNFPIVTAVEVRERFFNLTQNRSLYRTALGATMTISDIFGERVKDDEFFYIFHKTLRGLDNCAGVSRGEISLYSWMILKRFQLAVLKSQGYGAEHSPNFFQKDFKKTEDFFVNAFAQHFNYKILSWIPS